MPAAINLGTGSGNPDHPGNAVSVATEIVKDETAAHFMATAGHTVEDAVIQRLRSLHP